MLQRAPRPWLVVLALLVPAGLAAAQASLDGGTVPLGEGSAPAQTQRDINALYNLILPIALVIGILVEALLLYAIVRFRGKPGKIQDSGEHERGHTRLEIAWTIPPAVILLIVGLLSAQTLGAIEEGPPRDFKVKVIASQWVWNFEYPDGTVATNEMAVEAGKVVDLEVTATDVIHSFAVQSLGVKIDAIPGRVNHYWLKAEVPGDYQVQCMEYCAGAHAYMRAKVTALEPGSTARGWRPPGAGAGCVEGAVPQETRFLESGGSPWSVEPARLSLRAGVDYCFNVVNPEGQGAPHNLEIINSGGQVVATMHPTTILPGKSALMPAKFDAPGAYTYYCAVPGHRALGMEGPLTVA